MLLKHSIRGDALEKQEKKTNINAGNETGYKEETKASLMNFISEVANYAAVIATAVLTMSISIFMDLVNSTCNLLRTGICTFLSARLQKDQSFKYNYGTENLETISMLLCEMLLSAGTGAVMVFAIVRLFNPTMPEDTLIIGVIFKAVNLAVDTYLSVNSYRVYKKTGTKVAKTNFEGSLSATGFDAAILVAVLAAYIFRGYSFVGYVEPVASVLIAVIIIYKSVGRIIEYVRELTYVTLDEKDQMKIMAVLAHRFHDFEDFFSVNSHKAGKNVYIDFLVSFPKETTYGEIVDALKAMTEELENTFENCKVSIIFDSKNALTQKASE